MQYVKKGHFTYKLEDTLSHQTQTVPDGYGVYEIYANSNDGELLYIGKGGTIETDGRYKSQQLRKRLNANHSGIRRQNFFNKKLQEERDIKELYIEWYIIDDKKYLPAYYEAQLIQDYYRKNKKLPRWNKSF